MRTILAAIFTGSLAFCQAAQTDSSADRFTNYVRKHVVLAPKADLTARPKPKIPRLQSLNVRYQSRMVWAASDQDYAAEIGVAVYSMEAAHVQLNAIKRAYHRRGQGSFTSRFAYALHETITNIRTYNIALMSYQELGAGAMNPKTLYNYRRNHDPTSVLWRGFVYQGKGNLVKEFQPDALRILTKTIPALLGFGKR